MFTEADVAFVERTLFSTKLKKVLGKINDSNHTLGIIPEKVNNRSVKSPNDNT